MIIDTLTRRSAGALRGLAVVLALVTGVAPAAAEMRFERGSIVERTEYRTERLRGPRDFRDRCGPRARARGWCHGEPIGPHREWRGERAHAPRHPPRGTRIDPPRRGNDAGLAIALGIAGIAAGAVIAGSLSNDDRRLRSDRRFDAPVAPTSPPLPRLGRDTFPEAPSAFGTGAPTAVAPASNPYEPWSSAWLEACRERYRSFNARTGTFRGYDGRDHFCSGPR